MGRGLASIAPLALGDLTIRPATCEAEYGDTVERLEPRVMQVLVELSAEPGRVVSRDALIERCWDGVVVGDDAINRVTARIRRLGHDSGAFTLETLRKVGYRLVTDAEAPLSPTQRIARQWTDSPRRRAARATALVSTLLLGAISLAMYGVGRREEAVAAIPASDVAALASPVLARLPGQWGPQGCRPTYALVVRAGRIVMTAPGYRSERRIVAATDDSVLTEGVVPADEYGRLIAFRPDGGRLQIHNRSTDATEALAICPAAAR